MLKDKRNRRRKISPDEWYLVSVVAGIILAAAVMVLWETLKTVETQRIPDFASYENVDEKKEAFFQYLLPYIHEQNARLMEDRRRILELKDQFEAGKKISKRDRRWLREVHESVDFEGGTIEDQDFFSNLLSRVDAIPPSLALAQAANESAWGTSRFARDGNNYYGIWCYRPGCGIVPRQRPAGEMYEVTKYPRPAESVADYFQNLNTGNAYLSMRRIRSRLRDQGQPLSGIALANGLDRYSERGMAYVGDIQNLIRSNNLEQYDR